MNKKLNQLYRHFDSKGKLLYVGISLSTVARLSQHKLSSSWYEEISTITIENFDSREEALEAERKAIQNELPAHNIQGKIKETTNKQRSNQSRKYLFWKVVDFQPVYKSIKQVSEVLSVSVPKLKEEIGNGNLRYISVKEKRFVVNGEERVCKEYKFSGWHLIDYLENVLLQEPIDCGEE